MPGSPCPHPGGDLGEPYLITGGYLQDWLFLKTDWNWRLEAEQGGDLRVVADIGTHWMDLVTYLTGFKITEVMADFSTVHKTRLQPTGEVETFAGKIERMYPRTKFQSIQKTWR